MRRVVSFAVAMLIFFGFILWTLEMKRDALARAAANAPSFLDVPRTAPSFLDLLKDDLARNGFLYLMVILLAAVVLFGFNKKTTG